jgi:hypothetical protein
MRSAAIMADGNDENIVRLKGIRDTPRPPLDPDAAMPGSEDALALEFAEQHAAKLRWCNPWGAWLQWDAGAWQLIKTRFVFHLVRVIARKHAALLDDKRLAAMSHKPPSNAWSATTRATIPETMPGTATRKP